MDKNTSWSSLTVDLCDQCHRVLVRGNGRGVQTRHSVGKKHKCFSTTLSKVFSISVTTNNGIIVESNIMRSTQWVELLSGKKDSIRSYSLNKAVRTTNRRKNAQIRRLTKNSPIPQGLPTYMVDHETKVGSYK